MTASIGPYRLLARLGAGGMGEVLLAEDTRLGRRVALKSLTGDRADAPEARARLLHEARAAAGLNHPNIAAIYDVLEFEDRAFIVMEFVEGESLADRVTRGPLPCGEALAVASQLIDALVVAHGQGVVHRDLKPGNLVLTPGGRIKVLDFGIARVQAVEEADRHAAATAMSFTYAGQMVGTPGYSAPEQLTGGNVDARADIYGVGAVLFELLTGRPAFEGAEPLSRVLAALSAPPPSAAAINAEVPAEVSALVSKAMAREPHDRFQTARDMGAALQALEAGAAQGAAPTPAPAAAPRRPLGRGLLLAAVAAGSMLIGAAVWRGWTPDAMPSTGGPTAVAVLALQNLSGDASRDYVGVGVAETISTSLAMLPTLAVVSQAEVSLTALTADGTPSLARALGVAYLVRGSVQQEGDQLGVNLQLVNASGQVMWGERFEGRLGDLFDLQRRMAAGIGAALRIRTDGAAADAPGAGSLDATALAEYWQGRILLDRRDLPGNIERAIEAFEQAIAIDASLALAHAGLGEAYWALYVQTRNAEWTELAIRAALAAVRLAPEEPQARYSLAVIYHGSGRTTEAVEELRRVQALRPNHVDAPRLLGVMLAGQGRIDDAIAEFDKAIALRPGYVENYSQLGVALLAAHRYPEAEAAFRRVTELAPESARGYQQLGTLYQTTGDLPSALLNYRASVTRSPYAPAYSNIGSILYMEGRYSEAADAYRQAISLAPSRAITHRNLGDAYTRLGLRDEARAAYERAVQLTEAELKVNPTDAQNISRLAVYEAKLGRAAVAEQHAAEAVSLQPGDGTVLFRAAVVLALGGKGDDALRSLEAAVEAGYSVTLVNEEDDLASLRARPAFQALVQRQK
jgi:tetratricopeptide (TPR) repeat protein/predicted Ser/Thr protein kinase